MFECSLCLEELDHFESNSLHDGHQICIPCSQDYLFQNYKKLDNLPLKWNSITSDVEIDPRRLTIKCPLCRKICQAYITQQTIQKLESVDKKKLLQIMCRGFMIKLSKIESQSQEDARQFYIKQILEEIIVQTKNNMINMYFLENSFLDTAHSVHQLRKMQQAVLQQFEGTQQDVLREQFQRDTIKVFMMLKEKVLEYRQKEKDSISFEEDLRKQVKH